MPIHRTIYDFPPGDTFQLIRTVDPTDDGSVPTDAWFTVKSSLTDPDSLAYVNEHITPVGSGLGYINVYADTSSLLIFVVPAGVTSNMTPNATYYYDVEVQLSTGFVYTLESGKLFAADTVRQLP